MSKVIDSKDVRYVAKLAKLDLNKEQEKLFVNQLNDILSYFKQINTLDTNDIEPTAYILHSANPMHEDNCRPSLPQKVVLEMAKQKKDGYFKVPKIL